MDDLIFSLDIGTRNVVGMIGKMEGDTYRLIDYEIMEHPDRAMYDGQIHDIEKVSDIVGKVKSKLEDRLGTKLKYVSIAAAGRALKTQKVFVENEINYSKEINKSIINSLEMEGIQLAQRELEETSEDNDGKYYCVGYTVVNYYLDGSTIGNLKGHRGNRIGADILATFLPHVVVDSLYTVVHNAGLEVISLTLEPIAAINVAIPPKFRLLNLALVDVGAGTSDIAITKEGTIVSYAMVSVAGDEITEALSQAFLLDFNTAEKLKTELNKKPRHSFKDVVGMSYELETGEILSKLENSIKELTQKISKKIKEYNGKTPSAVFCIGGGCQIPQFTDYLAESLGLAKERVVVRGTEMLEDVEISCDNLTGPEYITPIGIGYTALKDKEQDFLKVTVNGKQIRLFNSRKLTVSDALILTGYNARKLIAQKGKPVSFILNGKRKVIYGEYGESAKIYVNGRLASLDTKLTGGDEIIVNPATQGKDAKVHVKDIIKKEEKIVFQGKNIKLFNGIYVNGRKTDGDYEVHENDEIHIDKIRDIKELMFSYDIDLDIHKVFANGKEVNGNYILKDGDVIEVEKEKREQQDHIKKNPGLEAVKIEEENMGEYIEVQVNGKKVNIEKNNRDPIFVDIFNYIDFDIKKAKGILELRLNGERANYTDILKQNDVIEIFWK
ncbi:MAG: hypothetical protein PWQ37_1823 [Candidatus Petromonas sp.]|jgi:cell division protein FtsA|nr:hypothetical protein [Candidatus Petromonas sp.]